jgi:rare lipoprotein A
MTPDLEVKRGRHRRAIVFIAVGAIICCAAPGMNISAEPVMPPIPPLPVLAPEHATYIQVGRCSWYGRWHQGRLTASGERFNMFAMTAAHRTLPLGTVIRVINPANGKMVKVRINDRGPYFEGRVLDLSAAAAKALGISKTGVANLRIETYASDQAPDDSTFRPTGRGEV